MAIFGENAAGKSSLSDAIEWFYNDRVEHLWRENCKESALRNTLLGEKTWSTVSLEFNNATFNSKKSLSPGLTSSVSNKTSDFTNYLSAIKERRERLILRNTDLLSFIVMTKGAKRQELERIIGYEALNAFRDSIGQTLYRLQNATEYIASRSSKEEHQREIVRVARTSVRSEKELYEAAERLLKRTGVSAKIANSQSYDAAVKEIQTRIHDKEKATRKLGLSDCKQKCDDVCKKTVEVNVSFDLFLESYAKLIKSEEQLKQAKLEELLSRGMEAIDARLVPNDTCPLCLQPKAWDLLRKELEERIGRLQESKELYDTAFRQKNEAMAKINEAVRAGYDLITYAKRVKVEGSFLKASETYNVAAKKLEAQIGERFEKHQAISENLAEATEAIVATLKSESKRLEAEVATLALSTEEQELLDGLKAIENLRAYYVKFCEAEDTVRKFETQIRALSKIKTDFSAVHTAALQKVLDVMSQDISQYYLAMHPQENVDDIRLRVMEDGVEFDYGFHGKRVYPPLKYLSESHLNSLGIAAFLASARLFNKTNGFFVLDDIVTSFDANHRVRLLHLLKGEFSQWQIILLTHEPFWFEMIKREMGPSGWLFREMEVLPMGGIGFKSSSKSMKAQIQAKRKDGTLAANELRTGMERMLKDIGFSLEVKVAFRFNDQNERRMPGELLSELRSTLKKKSPGILAQPVFSKVETCSLVTTTGSHDTGPILSSGDIATSCDDLLALDSEFYCEECTSYVSVERYVRHEDKIFCKCGKKSIPWNE